MKSLKKIKILILVLALIINVVCLASPAMASAGQDAVSIGGSVKAPEMLNGDAVAIFGNCRVEKGANGDVVAILGSAEAKGIVNGDVVAIGGNITIDGTVNGDVVAIGGKVVLKGNSVVNGQVAASQIEKGNEAIVRGGTTQTAIPMFKMPGGVSFGGQGLFGNNPLIFAFRFFGIFFNFLIVTLLLAIYPRGIEEIARSVEQNTWRTLLIGLVASIILVPIFITIIGIPVVIFLLLAGRFLGYSGVLFLVGRKFTQAINWDRGSVYVEALLGALLIGLVQMMPFLGSLVGIVVFWIAMGAMLDTKFGTGRPWFNRTM